MTFYVGFGPVTAIGIVDTGNYSYNFLGLTVRQTTGAFLPPPDPGNSGKGKGKGGSPGQVKKQEMVLAGVAHRKRRRKRRDAEFDAIAFIPAPYLSPGVGSSTSHGIEAVDWRRQTRRITISPSGHTVRKD